MLPPVALEVLLPLAVTSPLVELAVPPLPPWPVPPVALLVEV